MADLWTTGMVDRMYANGWTRMQFIGHVTTSDW